MADYIKEKKKVLKQYLELFEATTKKHGTELTLAILSTLYTAAFASALQEDITKPELDELLKGFAERTSKNVFILLQEAKKHRESNE